MNQIPVSNDLKASEEKFRTLFEFAPDAYFTTDLKGIFVDANAAAEKLSGYKREELIGKSLLKAELFSPSQLPKAVARLTAYVAGKVQEAIEVTLIKKDKTLVELEVVSAFIILDNKKRVLNIARDISREKQALSLLKASEKKYRDLFEKSRDATLIIENGRFVDCNKAAVQMLGFRRKKELLDKYPSELSPEIQADGEKSYEKAAKMMDIALNKGSHRFEWVHQKANGDFFPVEVLLTLIQSHDDAIVLHTVWRDITKRKLAEQELDKYHNHLEELIDGRTLELEISNAELLDKNKKLEHYNDLFVGREFRIKELREQVEAMEKENNKLRNL
jgi:PAS domain S-box-containing protein